MRNLFKAYLGSRRAQELAAEAARCMGIPYRSGEDPDGRPYLEGKERIYLAAIRGISRDAEERSQDGTFFFGQSIMLGHRSAFVYRVFISALACPGDIAECGAYYGETAREMLRFVEHHGLGRRVHLFDTFAGFPDIATAEERAMEQPGDPPWLTRSPGGLAADVGEVIAYLEPLTLYQVHQGPFSQTFGDFDRPLCFIHADADLYQSTREIIGMADRLLVPDGRVVFDDYGDHRFPGVREAVSEFLDLSQYDLYFSEKQEQAMAIRTNGGRTWGF